MTRLVPVADHVGMRKSESTPYEKGRFCFVNFQLVKAERNNNNSTEEHSLSLRSPEERGNCMQACVYLHFAQVRELQDGAAAQSGYSPGLMHLPGQNYKNGGRGVRSTPREE